MKLIRLGILVAILFSFYGSFAESLIGDPENFQYCEGGVGILLGVDDPIDDQVYTLQFDDLGTWINMETSIAVSGVDVIWFSGFYLEGSYRLVDDESQPIGSPVDVIENPLPAIFDIVGGGEYCDYGVPEFFYFYLDNSESGIVYTLTFPDGGTDDFIGTGGVISLGSYEQIGEYWVLATDPLTGCTNQMAGSAYIVVYDPPMANFTYDSGQPPDGCSMVYFTNTSTPGDPPAGAPITEYAWDFTSDGLIDSYEESPSYDFPAYGNGTEGFTVTLTITDENACMDSHEELVIVTQRPHASIFDDGIPPPWALCEGNSELFVGNNSSTIASNISYTIIWGDGTPDFTFIGNDFVTTSHVYPSADDSYELEVIVEGDNGCFSDTIYNVFVGSTPAASIEVEQGALHGCVPHEIVFYLGEMVGDNSPGTNYIFNWGDGTVTEISQENLPVPNEDGKYEIPHIYENSSCGLPDNAYIMELTIDNPCDDVTLTVEDIQISSQATAMIDPDLINDPILVCQGIPYTFSAAPGGGCFIFSSAFYTEETYYAWDFNNDGTIEFEGEEDEANAVSYTFPDEGTYWVKLFATTAPAAPDNCGSSEMLREIVVGQALNVNAGEDQVINQGESTELLGSVSGGSSPYLINWEPAEYILSGQGTLNPTTYILEEPTLFYLMVEHENGCFGSDMVFVNIENGFLANPIASPNQICLGDSTQLSANVSGGSGDYTYYWTPPDGLDDATIANPMAAPEYSTSYTVIIDDGVDDIFGEVYVQVDSPPLAYAGADALVCGNEYTVFDAFVENADSFFWFSDNGAISFNYEDTISPYIIIDPPYTGESQIILCANGVGGCQDYSVCDTMYITNDYGPEIFMVDQYLICENESIQIEAEGSNYSSIIWEVDPPTAGAFDDPNSLTPTFTPAPVDEPILFTITVYVFGIGICDLVVVEEMANVYVYPMPEVYAGPDVESCEYVQVQLEGAVAWSSSHYWEVIGENGPLLNDSTLLAPSITSPDINEITVYELVLHANGEGSCEEYIVTDTVEIVVSPMPDFFAGSDVEICEDIPYHIEDAFAENYSELYWDIDGPGSLDDNTIPNPVYVSDDITSLTQVSLFMAVTGAGACEATGVWYDTMEIIVHPLPEIISPLLISVCSGENVDYIPESTVPGTSYEWVSLNNSPDCIIGNSVSGTGPIQDILSNSCPGIESVSYMITAVGPAPDFCQGETQELIVEVYPLPNVTNAINSQDVISGEITQEVIFTSNIDDVNFTWEAESNANLSAYIPSGDGNLPAMTIINSGDDVEELQYTVVPMIDDCPGVPFIYSIFVSPLTGIHQLTLSNNILILPNPNDGQLYLRNVGAENIKCDVTVVNGLNERVKMIKNIMLFKNENFQISIEESPAGVYYLLIESQKGQSVKKIVKT